MKYLKNLENLQGKKVLVRVDFNVPIKDGEILDLYKIEKSLKTIRFLVEKRAKVVLISHLGRPENANDADLRLDVVAKKISEMLSFEVKKYDFLEIPELENELEKMRDGEVVLLENIRFYEGERNEDEEFAKELATLGDIFVLDGFGVAHRDAPSVSGLAKFLPSYAGFLLEEEIENLDKIKKGEQKPFLVIMGGGKVETKLPLIEKFLLLADNILIGGVIFNAYLQKKGYDIGASKGYDGEIDLDVLENEKVIKPVDVIVGLKEGGWKKVVLIDENNKKICEVGEEILDVGPLTIKDFSEHINNSNMILWNGAMGYFEQKDYATGTIELAKVFAGRAKTEAFCVAGGGETVEILSELDLIKKVDFVSTGGGAMLEYLAKDSLRGLAI